MGFNLKKEKIISICEIIFYGDREELVTIICDRTSVLAQAEEDLTILGEGKAPTNQVDLTRELNRISSDI